MRRLTSLLTVMMIILSFFPKSIVADSDLLMAEEVVTKAEYINAQKLEFDDYDVLYDINNRPSFLLIELKCGGYIIASRNNGVISEMSLTSNSPYKSMTGEKLYYYGPMNYTNFSIDSISKVNSKKVNMLRQKTDHFLSLKDDAPTVDTKAIDIPDYVQWTGIDESRFRRYNSGMWINDSNNYPESSGYSDDGICGTITSAIMLAYYDDYKNDNTVPSNIRTRSSSSPGKLITSLHQYIDEGRDGTLPYHLSNGINDFFDEYSSQSPYNAVYGLSTTFSTAKSRINSGEPICIGLLYMLGFSSDHWVVCYQYFDGSGAQEDYYKCINTWGDYTFGVKVSWTAGYAALD